MINYSLSSSEIGSNETIFFNEFDKGFLRSFGRVSALMNIVFNFVYSIIYCIESGPNVSAFK